MSRYPVGSFAGARPLWRALLALLLLLAARPAPAQGPSQVAGTVTDAQTGRPLAGATVRAIDAQAGTTTRSDGSYTLRLPAGSHTLRATLVGYAEQSGTVQVGAGQTARHDFALAPSALNIDAVVVVGSRGGERRTVTSSPVPVDVITADVIEQTGATQTAQIIQMLAPSFNFPRPSVTDGTDHVRPATLRGLSPDQVLVLVNGKRRHTSALLNVNGSIGRGSSSVDLNAIPAAAIERIEILREGAAAQYGSDAIAGVINIVLKQGAETELQSTAGQTREGDGEVWQVAGNSGLRLPRDGFLTLSAEYRDDQGTNRSRPDTRQQYFTGDPRNDSYVPVVNHRQGDAKVHGGGAFLNGALPLGDALQLYAFGGLTRRLGDAAGFFRRAQDDRTVRGIYPDGYLPLIDTDITDASLAAGVRGETAGWQWDLGETFGHNGLRYDIRNSVNVSMGTRSPTDFYAGTLRFNQATTNLDVTRPFDIGLASPLTVAWGGEFRWENYRIAAGDSASWMNGGERILDGPNAGRPAAYGAQVFPGFRPSDQVDPTRTNVAGYLDLEGNVTDQLLLGVAGRVEHYSDFGNTAGGKLSGRFEPVQGYALRGAVSTGFRAPSLAQQYFSATSTAFINVSGVATPFDVRTWPVSSPEARLLGAKDLEPETSVDYSLGVALNPLRSLSLTVDWYRIDVADRIVLSNNFVSSDITQLLAANGFTGIQGGRFFTNAVDTRTDGVDAVLNYGLLLPNRATARFTAGYNHNRTRVTHVADSPPVLTSHATDLFDRAERGRLEVGQPRDNLLLALGYTQGIVGLNLTGHRYGEVTSISSNTTPRADGSCCAFDQTFGARWIADADLSLRLPRGLGLAVGANNLFNTYPDEVIAANSNSGIFPYSTIAPFGYNGAYYYVRLNFRPGER